MKLEKVFFILSMIIVVALAGCAKQASVATAGVVIEKFTPQVSAVASNSPVELTLTVKNIGEREATEVKAVLGGLIFTKQPEHWKLGNEEILKPLEPASLEGEDVEAGFKGDQSIATWRLTAPTQARDQTYEPTVNLVYNYSTVSTILIKAVDFNYLQSLPENEQETIDTGVIVSKTTNGPILVSVKTDQAVISGSSTLPIEIEFKNIGGGRMFIGGGDEKTSDELYANIKTTGEGHGLNKILVELPSDVQCNLKPLPNKQYEIRLIEGKTGRILCNKVIPPTATVQTFSMDIKAEYRYLIEGKTAVKVSKTLYQPPIYDLSVTDSKFTIIHEHASDKIRVDFIARLTNIGNQPINDENFKSITKTQDIKKYPDGIEVFEAHSVGAYITEPRIILSKDKKLESFNSVELKEIGIEQHIPLEKKIVVNIKSSTNPPFDEDINTVNNQLNPKETPTILDYDISVIDLKAELVNPENPNDFSTKIIANVKNNAKNVDGIKIPITVTVDDEGGEISCKVQDTEISSDNNQITTDLEKSKDKNIVCIYQNTKQKLSFKIKAYVEKSSLDKIGANDYNDKPNGKDEFTIKFDITIVKDSSKFTVKQTEQNKVTYTLSTTVKNVGVVTAKDITVQFVDSEGVSVCEKEPGKIDILKLQTPETRGCDTTPIQILTDEKIPVTAKVSSPIEEKAPHEPNEEAFNLLPPDTAPPKLSDGLPTGVWATDSPTLSLKTDESATCRHSTKPNVKYDDMTDTFTKGDKGADGKYPHTSPLSKLSDGDYSYYVRCTDAFGNENTQDFKISFKVLTTLAILSVAGDTTSPYWDTADDKKTDITVAIASGIKCRWNDESKLYSEIASQRECTVAGTNAVCSLGSLIENGYGNLLGSPTVVPIYKRYVACQDSSGNDMQTPLKVDFYVDWSPPTWSGGELGVLGTVFNEFYKSTITVSTEFGENTELDKCEYSIDNGATWDKANFKETVRQFSNDKPDIRYKCEIILYDPQKDLNIKFRVTDKAGLTGLSTVKSLKFDNTRPVTTVTATSPPDGVAYQSGSQTNNDVKIILACTDTGSGCKVSPLARTFYCTDQTNTCIPLTTYSNPFTISAVGTTYARYQSQDNLGNLEEIKSFVVNRQ